MRIVVSDHSGHPFQAQLSRELARRGHDVLHLFSASFQTPKGRLVREDADPPTFAIKGLKTREPFAKHSFVKRRFQEIEMGRKIGDEIVAFAPDVVFSSNAAIDTQREILKATRKARAKFAFWVQDIYSHAIEKVMQDKLPVIGSLIAAYYRRLEGDLLRKSDVAVLIADDFEAPVRDLAGAGLPTVVIENWAPLDEMQRYPRDNSWAIESLPASEFRLIYSGTIGFKHNPHLLLALAEEVEGDVLVFSEGPAADWLKEEAAKRGLANLSVSGWLPFETLPMALSAADALIVVLEPEAGIYSVPSKVLTYMCIARPIIGAMPAVNLAARLISSNAMGKTVAPDDAPGFVQVARELAANPAEREAMGRAAGEYAERVFDIKTIGDKFETICEELLTNRKDGK